MYKTKLCQTVHKLGVITFLRKARNQTHSSEFNSTHRQTYSPSCCRSTPGHTPWFWSTSDGHYSLHDGNNNFSAVLMIVIIMLGIHSPNSVLIAVRQPQRGASELTSKVWFSSQWSAGHCSTRGRLSFSWWTSPFWFFCSILVLLTTQVLETREEGYEGRHFSFSYAEDPVFTQCLCGCSIRCAISPFRWPRPGAVVPVD